MRVYVGGWVRVDTVSQSNLFNDLQRAIRERTLQCVAALPRTRRVVWTGCALWL